MLFTLSLPVLTSGVQINCNQDAALFAENRVLSIWNLVNMLLSGPIHSTPELNFLERWLADGFLSADLQKTMNSTISQTGEGIVANEFKKVLSALRSELRESSWRATLYKHLFAFALHSDRDPKILAGMISTAREVLGIESLTAAFITDALLTAIPEIAYDMNKISTEDKEIIIALNFIALNADNQKHILEIDACRNAMATLSISAISNTALGTHTKKSISDLIKTLNPSNHPVALLYILRMVVADGRIQSDEISLLREVSNGLPKNQIKFLHMVTIFETGKFFKLA